MRKNRISIYLGVGLLLFLLTAGTFAWTSISQRAINEGQFKVGNPGGRVHDDYEGFDNVVNTPGGDVNKDIYAENYGRRDIYVRIKLTEYMELGTGAGAYTVTSPGNVMTPDASNKSTVLAGAGLDAAKLDDRSTWAPYLPGGLLADGSQSKLRDYIEWDLGDDNSQRKVYMPTFNQNNMDLSADTTGNGIDEEDWTKNANYDTSTKDLFGLQDDWALGEKHISTLLTYDETASAELSTPNVEHTAVETLTPDQDGYMTMADWTAAGEPTGNFWVHDNDGWIYWANPLPAKSATSLLLDKFKVTFPTDDMYYAINVISEFATSDELSLWTNVSSDAQRILDKIK